MVEVEGRGPTIDQGKTLTTAMFLLVMALSFVAASSHPAYAASYNMKYNLTYMGVPFAGGAIVLASNFTNIGQVTIRVTSVSFASDFWSNGTRQVSSGLLLNLTAGTSTEIDTPVAIPAGTSIGNHVVTATAFWQYSGPGWSDASPIIATTKVSVSQTIGSLFASLATGLVIGVVVAAVTVLLVVLIVVLRKRKSKRQPSPLAPPS